MRLAVAVLSSGLLASGCVVNETYAVPYEALHTMSNMNATQRQNTAVPAKRVSNGADAYVRASTFDLTKAASGVGANDRVNLETSEQRSLMLLIIGGVGSAIGAALIGVGGWLISDSSGPPSDSGELAGGIAALAGGALILGGGLASLGLAFTLPPQQVATGKSDMIYLDQTGRLPQSTSSVDPGRLPRPVGAFLDYHFQ
jgi:hypothetical protein